MASRFWPKVGALGYSLVLAAGICAADDLSHFATFVVEAKDLAETNGAEGGGAVDLVLLPTKAHELQVFTEHHVGKIVIFRWQKADRARPQATPVEHSAAELIREPITDGVIHIDKTAQPQPAQSTPSLET